MYCPYCGQQQISDEVRFCSRCGFPLAGLAQLLANGGAFPLPANEVGKAKLSPKQRGIRQGVFLGLLGTIIVPLLGVINAPGELIGFAAIVCFVGGLVRLLYALMFQEDFAPTAARERNVASPYDAPPTAIPNSNVRDAAQLSPPRPSVVGFNTPRVNTAELVPPPSVTEHTTRLLKDKADDAR